MTRVRVKVCCIASEPEAALAARLGADLLGLVGPMPTGPGVIDLPTARRISLSAPLWARPILLTSSETASAIQADADEARVQAVQVVRHIAAEQAAALARAPLHYVQVIHVEDAGALDLIDVYAPYCAAFLLDSGRPKEEAFGGTGVRHDWSISAAFVRRAPRPVFLAGGLTPDNVGAAIALVAPFGVDVCSGLRPEGGLDAERLASFLRAAQTAGAEARPHD